MNGLSSVPPARSIEVYNSVGGAAFFEQLLAVWESYGWRINRLHALHESDYRAPRGLVGRAWLRWRMYGAYAWTCWRAAGRRSAACSIRVTTTNPFFAPALVQRAAGKDGVTINLLYDLYPDALVHAGVLRSDSWVAERCAAITRTALRECAATVFLGEHLRRYAETRYGAARRGVVIPVGADGRPFRDNPPRPLSRGESVTMLYAGHMGRMHDVDTVADAMMYGLPAGVRLQFHATGAGYSRLRSKVPATAAEWGGSLDDAVWKPTMANAQIALVTMAPGAEEVVMPSKTYSALVAGQAVLAVCPLESDLAALIAKHDCGWVVAPGDVETLNKILQLIADSPDVLHAKRLNAFSAGHLYYDSQVLARRWLELFDSIGAGALL